MNVLLTCAGRRNYLVRYFREALDGRGAVLGADLDPAAPALAEVDVALTVPRVDDPGYIDRLLELCGQHEVGLLVSLNDLELPRLAADRDRFRDAGVTPVVSAPDVVDTCFDKMATARFLRGHGIRTPATFDTLDDALAALDRGDLAYPVILKPRWGTASIAVETAHDRDELTAAHGLLRRRVARSIVGAASQADPERAVLVQERLTGQEHGLDVVNDLDGNHAATLARAKLAMRSGETDRARTVEDPALAALGRRLGQALGHVGNLDCDVFVDEHGPAVLELNPRFGGGYPFSHAAGADVPAALLAWAEGRTPDPAWLRLRPGEIHAKCDRLVGPVAGSAAAPDRERIYLSPPHLGGLETRFIRDAIESNWVAPLGPNVDAFEREFAERVGAPAAAALSSGTAALHVALRLLDVGPGDEVLVSSLTFAASATPVRYLGATPVFIDSERTSWNMDPALLAEALEDRAARGRLPKAVVVVHLYGQAADMDAILQVCDAHGVPVVEDAAEALGASYRDRPPGSMGQLGIFSFNGNKIITTSGGGMLVARDPALVERARWLASQAREPVPHYEHRVLGYNYRMSNILAGMGRGQLRVLERRVAARRRNFELYREALDGLPGIEFMPEAEWGTHSRWLTTLTVDPAAFGEDRDAIRERLEAAHIEARPVWKPMHLQPLFEGCEAVGGGVAEDLFTRGLCLPSGSDLEPEDVRRISRLFRGEKP